MPEMTESFLVKLAPDELAALDRMRGEAGRSTWVRDLVAAAARVREQFGGPCHIHVLAVPPEEAKDD